MIVIARSASDEAIQERRIQCLGLMDCFVGLPTSSQ